MFKGKKHKIPEENVWKLKNFNEFISIVIITLPKYMKLGSKMRNGMKIAHTMGNRRLLAGFSAIIL